MSMETKARLPFLQEWMYRRITDPQGVLGGSLPGSNDDLIPTLIRSTATLGAHDRLAIYHNAYHLRLMQVLETEYPALKCALGEKLFSAFALFYLQQSPPSSFTLHELSARLPDFLAHSVPREDAQESWPDFILSLVRLERLFQEVYRGPGPEGKAPFLPTALPRRWRKAVFETNPGVRLLHSLFPVHEFLIAARSKSENDEVPIPEPAETWLVVHRRNYQVKIHPVKEKEFTRLEGILAGKSAEAAGVRRKEELAHWIDEGLILGAHTAA